LIFAILDLLRKIVYNCFLVSCKCLQDPPDWSEILTYFRGSELQNYFTKILEDDLKAVIKPQYVDQIPKAVKVCQVTVAKLQKMFTTAS